MKLIAIGDIHGRDTWKEIVLAEKDADIVVFVGDYFDSRDKISAAEQIHNFKEIIDYKISCGKKVIALRGNHDCHYLWSWDERYSGYQHGFAIDIRECLEENKEHLQMAYIFDDTIFTHAGVTKQWCKDSGIVYGVFSLDQEINDLFEEDRSVFMFNGTDEYGDNITQSPIWVRPRSLAKDTIPMRQVFGHTGVKKITALSINEKKDQLWPIDCIENRQYLCIEDGVFSVKELE